MLPEKLYESLPYLYAGVGVATLFMMPGHPVLTSLSGALLFVAGGLVWVIRSEHRRRDLDAQARFPGPLPFWCYELLPFGYILTALMLFAWASNPWLFPSAVIFLIIGNQLWLLRSSQRNHKNKRFSHAHIHS
ncbi:MAG: hypothetical protein LAT66_11105 [Alkalimonas sp.]|nr:hypothetical protein [Alkalimonas sp.]